MSKGNTNKNKSWILATAKAVAEKLKPLSAGTNLRIRSPRSAVVTNTDGWAASIGDLGKDQPKLEIWYDHFTGYPERKLWACFSADDRTSLKIITKRVSKTLWPTRTVRLDDTDSEKFLVLSKRLGRSEFNAPILEEYEDRQTYFGIYDSTRETSERINPYFVDRATAFFEEVARSLPLSSAQDEQREIYPQVENRQRVTSHLQRERSRLLASDRKNMDNYECQVCGLRFEDVYGKKLGHAFAEAHHIVPLSQLRGKVRTSIEDLRTVCANCHRMLHRMDGQKGDISKLKAIVRKNR